MAAPSPFRCAVLSAVKHDYVARGMAAHPRFELAVVADDPHVPAWAHERNQQLADEFQIPYVQGIERALAEHDVQVAIVSPEAERHADLSIRAARAGKHIVQDKPLATDRMDAERLKGAVVDAGVRFLMWNRNFLPAVQHARELIASGAVGETRAIHTDFYFAKDAGPPLGSRPSGEMPHDWLTHQLAAHADGSDGGLGTQPLGELSIEGIYPLAYIHMLTGAAVQRVFARTTAHFHQLYADNGVEDLATVSLEMDGGILGTVALGRIGAASHASGGAIKLHILGTQGALVIDESRPAVGIHYRDQPPRQARERRVAGDNDFQLAQDFAEALDDPRRLPVLDIFSSYSIFCTVQAALESARTGQVALVTPTIQRHL
jgi:predicted dehydrogenase